MSALLGSVTPTGFGFDKQSAVIAKAVLVLLYGEKAAIFMFAIVFTWRK